MNHYFRDQADYVERTFDAMFSDYKGAPTAKEAIEHVIREVGNPAEKLTQGELMTAQEKLGKRFKATIGRDRVKGFDLAGKLKEMGQ